MKILISGGIKTTNITKTLERKFSSSGIDFVVAKNIEDIKDIFSKGEYFDRALIIEQSWTHNDADKDETSIRQRLNRFSRNIKGRLGNGVDCIFVANSKESADIVSDETVAIYAYSAIVVYKEQFSVSFIATLIKNDLKSLPKNLLYTGDSLGEDIEIEDEELGYEEVDEPEYNTVERENLADTLMDSDNTFEPKDFSARGKKKKGLLSSIRKKKDKKGKIPEQQVQEFETVQKAEPEIEDDLGYEEVDDEKFKETGEGFGYEVVEDEGFEEIPDEGDEGFEEIPDEGDEGFEEIPDIPERKFTGKKEDKGFEEIPDEGDEGFEEMDEGEGYEEVPDNIEDKAPKKEEDKVKEHRRADIDEPLSFDTEFDIDGVDFDEFEDDDDEDGGEGYEEVEDELQHLAITNHKRNNNEEMEEQGETEYDPDGFLFDESEYSDNSQGSGSQVTEDNNLDDYYTTPETEPEPEPEQPKKKGKKKSDVPVIEDEYYNEGNRPSKKFNRGKELSTQQINATLDAFASRGSSIVLTGCGGCGNSIIAYNLANIINSLGYTVLLVDMDTTNRTQAFITKDSYECVNSNLHNAPLMAALNSSSGILNHVDVIKPGFNLLTMAIGGDVVKLEKIIDKSKITRFLSLVKSNYNFVVYDIPFHDAVGCAADITYSADNLVITVDGSNWGIMKALLSICNVESADMQETIFTRAEILFNKYKIANTGKVMDKKIKKPIDILKCMDEEVYTLAGEDPGYYFQDLYICGVIHEIPALEDGWFNTKQFSDTRDGQQIFADLLQNIILKR